MTKDLRNYRIIQFQIFSDVLACGRCMKEYSSNLLIIVQKYGSGMMGSGGRNITPGSAAPTAGSTGPIYTPGSPLVTTIAGQNLTSQGGMRTQAPPAIAVRITTAPLSTSSTSTPVNKAQFLGKCF